MRAEEEEDQGSAEVVCVHVCLSSIASAWLRRLYILHGFFVFPASPGDCKEGGRKEKEEVYLYVMLHISFIED